MGNRMGSGVVTALGMRHRHDDFPVDAFLLDELPVHIPRLHIPIVVDGGESDVGRADFLALVNIKGCRGECVERWPAAWLTLPGSGHRAELGHDGVIVADVVAVIVVGRRVDRGQPDHIDAQIFQVIEFFNNPAQVANAVAVAVVKTAGIDPIDDAFLSTMPCSSEPAPGA